MNVLHFSCVLFNSDTAISTYLCFCTCAFPPCDTVDQLIVSRFYRSNALSNDTNRTRDIHSITKQQRMYLFTKLFNDLKCKSQASRALYTFSPNTKKGDLKVTSRFVQFTDDLCTRADLLSVVRTLRLPV